MEENKKNVSPESASDLPAVDKNHKLKVIGIVLGIIVIVALASFSVLSILGRNGMSAVQKSEMGFGMAPESDSFGSKSLMMERSVPSAAVGNVASDSFAGNYVDNSETAVNVSTDKKVIKNGNLSLKVSRVDSAQADISEIAGKNGGEIFSSNIYETSSKFKSGTIVIKVPVDNFEKAIAEIKKIASLVIQESTTGQDVSAEYQDLEIRIKNKQAEEQSYVRILDQAQKIDDVLAVTRQLSNVRGEIERLQGQLRFMASQTDMSTISISVSEDQNITVTDSWRPFQVAKDAVNQLIKSVQGFVNFLIVFVVTFIPVAFLYFLVIAMIYLLSRKIYRRFKKNKDIE